MKKIILFILILSIGNVLAQVAPTSGLVAYWPLDGNFNDASGNVAAGTNTSATVTTNKNGVANKAMAFANPTATVAQVGTHPITAALNFTALQNFTFSFWVYLNSPYLHSCGIYDNNLNTGGYGAFFWNSPYQNVTFMFRGTQIKTTSGAIPLATWKHISCVKNGSSLLIYVDGVLNVSGTEGTSTPSYPFAPRFGSLVCSCVTPNNYNGMEGKLDEVRIYNRALLPAELTAVALPIRLSSFSGSLNNYKTILSWQTEYEQNAKDFVIQRSIDNTTFDSIGKVNAVGNTNTITKYNFEENVSDINANKIYYRLQLNDIDGKQSYSDIITLKKASSKIDISIYPNPTKDKIQVQANFVKAADAIVKIISVDGKIVLERTLKIQAGNNNFPIDLSSLEKGNYFLNIETEEEKYVKEIIKQ
jgi:hypothetical protein